MQSQYDWAGAATVAFWVIVGWLGLSAVLDLLSGLRAARRRYPDRPGGAARTLHFVSGEIGWFGYRTALIVDACAAGLRVRQPWLFSPLGKPIFVPWSDVGAEGTRGLFQQNVAVDFGHPKIGRVVMPAATWEQIREAAPAAPTAT